MRSNVPSDGIVRGQAAVGKYDGKHPSLTCATSGGKVFIHSPHNQELGAQTVAYLNINRAITSILGGIRQEETVM